MPSYSEETEKTKKKRKVKAKDVPSIVRSRDSDINIRKIENGLVVRISKHENDRYISKEFFAESEQQAKEIVGKAI